MIKKKKKSKDLFEFNKYSNHAINSSLYDIKFENTYSMNYHSLKLPNLHIIKNYFSILDKIILFSKICKFFITLKIFLKNVFLE